MRSAITIIHNGLHHLQHNGFADFMLEHFDYWVVVEGHARPGGSTSWCKNLNIPHRSTDGTVEFMESIKSDKLLFYTHHKYYQSKDEQFNKGIQLLKTKTKHSWLWQVDCDEHWKIEDIEAAEHKLWRSVSNCASFQFNHYVGSDYVARGQWGSGRVNRLWKWRGQLFASHEPAVMQSQRPVLELPQKFEHYSMVFDQDVKAKSKYYRGHELVYSNFKKLDTYDYPCHISKLFGTNNPIGRSDSYLYKINDPCANALNLASQNAEIKC
jgi:hypothetical protein